MEHRLIRKIQDAPKSPEWSATVENLKGELFEVERRMTDIRTRITAIEIEYEKMPWRKFDLLEEASRITAEHDQLFRRCKELRGQMNRLINI